MATALFLSVFPNGKTTTLSLFLDSLFPKTEIPYICEMIPLEAKFLLSGGKLLTQSGLRGVVFLGEMSRRSYNKKECKEQKEHHSCKIGTWNVRTIQKQCEGCADTAWGRY